MLVLSRREGESIQLPEFDVEIRVIGLRKSKVQLGISAPKEILVSRGELAERCPGTQHAPGQHSSAEQQRLISDLTRLETELLALAEMGSETNRDEATRIAGEAIERVAGIRRSILLAARNKSEPTSISQLLAVRAEVIDRLRIGQPKEACPTEFVRQSPSGYQIMASGCGVA